MLSTTRSKTSRGTWPKRFREGFGHFNHIEVFLAPHQFQLHGLVFEANCFPIRGLGTDGIRALQAEPFNDGGFEAEPRGPVFTDDSTSTARGPALRALAALRKMSFSFVSLIFTNTLPRCCSCGPRIAHLHGLGAGD